MNQPLPARNWLGLLGGRSHREARLRRGALLALLVGVGAAFLLWGLDLFQSTQWSMTDRLFRDQTGSPNVVIAAIDDATLAQYGRFDLWPRGLHAQAVENLRAAGARLIALDILFAEPTEDDERLAQAIAGHDDVILAAAGTEGLPLDDAPLYRYRGFLTPPGALGTAAMLAHVNLPADGDGVVRRVPLMVADAAGRQYPALALAAFYRAFRQPVPDTLDSHEGTVRLINREAPLTGHATLRINYVGTDKSFVHVPYGDIIDGRFDASLVEDRLVLVGMTATAGSDAHASPLRGDPVPGVELHANVLDTLLRGRFLREEGAGVALVVLLATVLFGSVVLSRLSLVAGTGLTVLAIAAYLVTGWALFDRGHVLNLVHPPAALAVVYVVTLVHREVAGRADRRDLRALFGRYVSDQVAEELVTRADRGDLSLGGEQREVTILFADLRGFTALSERVSAEQVVEYLNRCFDVIISRVVAQGGMVNKFGGDCIMAVWNAPQQHTEHRLAACRAALESIRQLEEVPGAPGGSAETGFGFGINSGPVLAGSVGSAGRSEYTVIGDAVNLASRLCGLAGKGEVWLGEETFRPVQDRVTAEPLPPMTVKGKAEPVPAYRLLALAEARVSAAASGR